MSTQSFKVKSGITLNPTDLSTLTSPEPGDLACDINDNNKIKRYDQERADWVEVGSGGGGGLDVFYSENVDDLPNITSFDKGNNASFMGGGTMAGTFSFEEINPISGLKSLKYVQAASGSLNDYFASDFIDVDPKQQGKTCGLTLYFNYNGDNGDGRFVVFDATNNQVISDQLALVENTGGQASRYSLSFTVPPSCNQIRWGYQVLVQNSGADLLVDDVEMSTNPFTNIAFDRGSVGEIKAFAGPVDSVSFLECDGRAVSRAGYSELFDRIGTTHGQGDGSSTFNLPDYRGRFLRGVDGAAGRDPDKASRTAMNTGGSTGNSVGSVQGDQFRSHRHDMTSNATNGSAGTAAPYSSVAAPSYTNTDDIQLSGGNETRPINAYVNYGIRFKADNDAILLPSDTFSTDTAPLTYAPETQYTLSTLENAPVGTFITFTYAANTNTRSQTTTAPSQSTADMNANGIRIFTRPFNAASTAASPAAIAVQIGKGLKGHQLNLYKSAGKVTAGSLDYYSYGSGSIGFPFKEYNEKTGIFLIDGGNNYDSGKPNIGAQFNDGSTQTSGYLTINAGKTLPLLAIPTPLVGYLKDIKPSGVSGGTFTSGSWQTRTLNVAEGDFNKFGTLSGNQFTLQPGTYEIEASAPAYKTNRHKIKLKNVTIGSDVTIGSTECSPGNDDAITSSTLKSKINVTSSQSFEIQHQCQTSRLTDGYGLESNFGVSEIYTQVKITRLG